MADDKFFEEFDRRMRDILARSPAANLEKNLRAMFQSAFGRLDLVSREEFDVQREVRARQAPGAEGQARRTGNERDA